MPIDKVDSLDHWITVKMLLQASGMLSLGSRIRQQKHQGRGDNARFIDYRILGPIRPCYCRL